MIEEEVKVGTHSREAHLKTIEQYVKLKKIGRKFIVREIYEVAKSKKDKRCKYLCFSKALLLHYFYYKKYSNEFTISRSEIYNILGLPSVIYRRNKLKSLINNDIELQQTQSFLIYMVLLQLRKKVNLIIEGTLKNLVKEKLISYEETYIIHTEKNSHLATYEEREIISKIKDDVLKEMGYKSLYSIMINPSRYDKYWDEVNAVYELKYGWTFVAEVFKINLLNLEILSLYKDVDSTNIKNILCDEIKNNIQKSIENKSMDLLSLVDTDTGEIKYDKFIITENDANDMKVALRKLL
ncbi:MAG: hypothetical protein IJ447_04510 [Clostridia bacterium]|nr:hypothetical protein [Clostridia bacterium]